MTDIWWAWNHKDRCVLDTRLLLVVYTILTQLVAGMGQFIEHVCASLGVKLHTANLLRDTSTTAPFPLTRKFTAPPLCTEHSSWLSHRVLGGGNYLKNFSRICVIR